MHKLPACMPELTPIPSLQMRVTPSGVEFLEAVDCSLRDWREEEGNGEDETPEKDAEFLSDTILAAIKRQSEEPPVAIFMDNASVCIAAGKLLEADPHLSTTFFVPCSSHCLDLLIEDIAKVPQFAESALRRPGCGQLHPRPPVGTRQVPQCLQGDGRQEQGASQAR